MSSTSSRSSAGPILGLLLLLLVVGGVIAALMMMKPGDGDETDVSGDPVKIARTDRGTDPVLPEITLDGNVDPSAAQGDVSFTIRCLGQDGAAAPLGDVEVFAAPIGGTMPRHDLKVSMKTDASGIARFEKMPYDSYQIDAHPAGSYPLSIRGVKNGDDIPMVFGEAVRLSGTVVSSEGEGPQGDVYVQIRSGLDTQNMIDQARRSMRAEDEDALEQWDAALPTFRTQTQSRADGTFEFAALPVGYEFTLSFDDPRFDLYEETIVTESGQDRINQTYVLLPRTRIFGKVIDESTGEAIAGALLRATEGGVPVSVIEQFGAGEEIFETTSAEDGSYELIGIPRGRQYFLVEHPGFDKYQETFDVTELEPFEKQITLRRGAAIAGIVADAAGNPIEGALVTWTYPELSILGDQMAGDQPAFDTQADGKFRFEGIPVERPIHVVAVHPDYVSAREQDLVLTAGESYNDLELTLRRGGSITGVVQTSSRQVVEGAEVTARQVDPPGGVARRAVSKADGSYVITNTKPGLYEVSCVADGFCTVTHRNVRETTTGVDFNMVGEAILLASLKRRTDDEPVTRFKVRARRAGGPDSRADLSETFRDKEGKLEIRGLTPGDWNFEITSDELAPIVLEEVTMLEGEVNDQSTLYLDGGITAVGTVTSVNGRAAPSALVRFDFKESFLSTDKTYNKLQVRADSNGAYELPNLLPGRYEVWATHPRFAQPTPMEVFIEGGPEQQIDFTLQRPAQLRLIVRDEEGNPVPGASVSLFQGNSPMEKAERVVSSTGITGVKLPDTRKSGILSLSDADSKRGGGLNTPVNRTGELKWERKEPGEWTLWIGAAGFYRYTERLTLIAGKEVVHEAVMERIKDGEDQRSRRDDRNAEKRKEREQRKAEGKGKGNKKKQEGEGEGDG